MRLAAILMATLFAQTALADDASSQPAGQRTSDWSGAYAGATAGVGTSSGRAKLKDFQGSLLPLDVEYGLFPQGIKGNKTGGLIGIGAGYNLQTGAFVRGLEVDLGYASVKPHHEFSRIDNVPSSPFPGVSTNTNYTTDFGVLGTLRARAGYAFGDTLIFGTAGIAAGHVRNRFELSLVEIGYTSPNWGSSGTRFGYTAGIGIEHRVSRNVSIKFETLYVNLADRTIRGTDSNAFPGESISYRFSNDLVISRFGFNVKF